MKYVAQYDKTQHKKGEKLNSGALRMTEQTGRKGKEGKQIEESGVNDGADGGDGAVR